MIYGSINIHIFGCALILISPICFRPLKRLVLLIEGKARSKTVKIINDFIDEHEAELMELWGRAQRGEKITKIR